jgi:hypothetical protein
MIPLQNDSVGVAFSPTSVTAGASPVGNVIDTLGARVAQIILSVSSATTTSRPTSIVLSEGDTTTAFATWTGSTFNTTSPGYPTQVSSVSTAAQQAFASLNVDLLGRKRYLQISMTGPTANSYVAGGVFVLGREEQSKSGTALGARFVASL